MAKGTMRVLALTACVAAASSAFADTAQLQQLFQQPPDDARPMVRWWWFGPAVTKEGLEREMKAMKAGGYGGFEVQPTYPLATENNKDGVKNFKFLSPEFLDDLKFAAAKAKELGLRMDLTLGSGWPYGGPMITPEDAAARIKFQRERLTPGKPAPEPKLRDGESVLAAFAGPIGEGRGDAADVSGLKEVPIKDGTPQLPTDLPANSDLVYVINGRTGMQVKRPALGAEGNVLNHLSAAASEKFIQEVADIEVKACGENPPHSVFCDSLEDYGQDWTDQLLTEFQKRRGYDLRPLLPALMANIGPKTDQVRHDWGQTITEIFNDEFAAKFRDFAHSHQTKFRIQAYGTPAAGLYSYAYVDLPEGEGYQWHVYRASRYAASASHLMGIPVTSSETFTWLHPPVFRATPLDIKAEVNQHFLQGINQVVCHGWPYTPDQVPPPGWSFYAAAVFNSENPWYIAASDVTRYEQRMSALLRQGAPANDVALYLANDDAWSNFTPGHASLTDGVGERLGRNIVGDILDSGHDLDFFDDQMLERFGKVDGNALAFGDSRYKVVVLAGVEEMPLATLQKLETFAKGGGIVIATRRIPDKAPGYKATDADDKAVQEISNRLFKNSGALGVFVQDEKDFAGALATRLAPDVAFAKHVPQVGFVHRHVGSDEVYFLANTNNQPVDTDATFRVAPDLKPEQWDPMTGNVAGMTAKGTMLPLHLEPYGSTVIVWSDRSLPAAPQPSGSPTVTDLSTNWNVQFGTDASPEPMATLHSWAEDRKDYSGVAVYTKQIDVPAGMIGSGKQAMLNFGTSKPMPELKDQRQGSGFFAALDGPVRDAAVVYVNGKRAGAVFAPPYSLDVTSLLKQGTNDLRIEVGNTQVNWLAVHGFPNYDYAGLRKEFGNRFGPARASEFQTQPSGLLGPVQLVSQPMK